MTTKNEMVLDRLLDRLERKDRENQRLQRRLDKARAEVERLREGHASPNWLDCDRERQALRGMVAEAERQRDRAVYEMREGLETAGPNGWSHLHKALAILIGDEAGDDPNIVREDGE